MHDVTQLIGLLAVLLTTAKAFGRPAKRIGQPADLGELTAGVVLGLSVTALVDPKSEILRVLAELGVISLLFEIGLQTHLRKLILVGPVAAVVALVGVALPFALGYAVCIALGLDTLVAMVAGAALTATSEGITARVLSDLGRLQEPESQVILGAAVIDDVVGLVILSVVAGLTQGEAVTVFGVAKTTGIAFGFLGGTLLFGRFVAPPLVKLAGHIGLPGTPTMLGDHVHGPAAAQTVIPSPAGRSAAGAGGHRGPVYRGVTASGEHPGVRRLN